MSPEEQGWYWLKIPKGDKIRSGTKYGWMNLYTAGSRAEMVYVRPDAGKIYILSKDGCLKSYRIKDIPDEATWRGPLKP